MRKSRKDKSSPPEPSNQTSPVPPLLFHPHLRDASSLAESLRTEKTLTLRTAWTMKDAKYIQQWLETRNFDHLADLLRLRPHNMANPLVFFQIFHLRNLLNWGAWDEEDRGYTPLVEGQAEPLSYGTKRVIKTVLHQLLGAWVGTMLPGYAIQPLVTSRKKGPPNRLDEYESQQMLGEFNDLMVRLDGEEEAPVKKRGETASAFCKRVADLVQRLHRKSRSFFGTDQRKCESSPSTHHNGSLRTVSELLLITERLKASVALSVARQCIGKTGNVRPRKLVYSLLALHHPDLGGPERVRGHIERAEGKFPKDHKFKVAKRKASHHPS